MGPGGSIDGQGSLYRTCTRDGRARRARSSEDGELEVDLRRPKEMDGDGGFKPAVVLDVSPPSVGDRGTAAQLVRDAHQVCPYSNATRGNIDVDLRVGGEPV